MPAIQRREKLVLLSVKGLWPATLQMSLPFLSGSHHHLPRQLFYSLVLKLVSKSQQIWAWGWVGRKEIFQCSPMESGSAAGEEVKAVLRSGVRNEAVEEQNIWVGGNMCLVFIAW